MIAILTLIATLDCTQPRVRFEPFFEAKVGYKIGMAPRWLQGEWYLLDLAKTAGDFADYVGDYHAKCGRSPQ